MSGEVDWIADAQAAGTELRQLIAEAHAATKDLKRAKSEIELSIKTAKDELAKLIDGSIAMFVQEGLDRYGSTLDSAIKSAETAILRRFDTITDLLMGRDAEIDVEALAAGIAASRRKGRPKGKRS